MSITATTVHNTLICKHAPGWIDSLLQEIEALASTTPDANVFALLDCAFTGQTHTALQQQKLPFRTLFDLSANPSSALQAVSPTLVPLFASTVSSWRSVLQHTDGWPMLSILLTPETLDELAHRLSAWCIVSADGMPFVFRFSDTRRLPPVVDVLTPEQHGAFFGPAIAWRYRTRSANWAELPLPATPLAAAERVKLDAHQCAQLIRESEADEVLALLQLKEPAILRLHDPATAHELVARGLKQADRYSLADADRLPWCALVVQQPKLVQMPAAIPLLASLRSGERSFADVKDALTELAMF